MLPLNSVIKAAFINLTKIFKQQIYLRVNTLKLLPPLPSGTRWDSLVMRTGYKNLIQTLSRSVFVLSPMGKVPLPILKELEHQARQNISTLNFTTTFAKTSSACNSTLEKCQHSLKSAFKKVKSQIRKGADPDKVAKREYEEACEYLDLWNKTLIIQHMALT